MATYGALKRYVDMIAAMKPYLNDLDDSEQIPEPALKPVRDDYLAGHLRLACSGLYEALRSSGAVIDGMGDWDD